MCPELFSLRESQFAFTPWTVFSTYVRRGKPIFSPYRNIYLLLLKYVSPYSTDSSVNLIWFSLLSYQTFKERRFFLPDLDLRPFWKASKLTFLLESDEFFYFFSFQTMQNLCLLVKYWKNDFAFFRKKIPYDPHKVYLIKRPDSRDKNTSINILFKGVRLLPKEVSKVLYWILTWRPLWLVDAVVEARKWEQKNGHPPGT